MFPDQARGRAQGILGAPRSRRKTRCGLRSGEPAPCFIGQRGGIIFKSGNAANVPLHRRATRWARRCPRSGDRRLRPAPQPREDHVQSMRRYGRRRQTAVWNGGVRGVEQCYRCCGESSREANRHDEKGARKEAPEESPPLAAILSGKLNKEAGRRGVIEDFPPRRPGSL